MADSNFKLNINANEVESLKLKIDGIRESIEKLDQTKAHIIISIEQIKMLKSIYKKLFWKIYYKKEI